MLFATALQGIWLLFTSLRDMFTSIQPFVVVFNGCLGLIISGMTLYLLIRTRPRQIKTKLMKPGAIIVNWSGHPLPETPWITPFKLITPEATPHFNVESWDSIRQSVQKMWRDLPKDIQLRLLQGDPDIIIVIPQLAAGVSILLATIHGHTGTFPTITSPLRRADGNFWLPEPINLGEIRIRSRVDRNFKTN